MRVGRECGSFKKLIWSVFTIFLYFNLSAKISRFVLQMKTIWKIEDRITYFIFSKYKDLTWIMKIERHKLPNYWKNKTNDKITNKCILKEAS